MLFIPTASNQAYYFCAVFICLCSVQSITNVRKAMQSLGCALCGLEQL